MTDGVAAAAGGYTISGEITIAAASADLVAWLTEPEAMDRWMVGVDGLVVLDDGTLRVLTSMGHHAGWVFLGTLAEAGSGRVVRSYALEELTARGAALAADTSTYARTVTYELAASPAGGTRLTCTAETVIPGLAATAAETGARKEQQTLRRSLERLDALASGRGVGLLGRLRGSGGVPCPL